PVKPVAQVSAAIMRCDERTILGSNEPDFESLRVCSKTLEGKFRNECPDDLLLVGMDKDAWFHHATPRTPPIAELPGAGQPDRTTLLRGLPSALTCGKRQKLLRNGLSPV